MTQYFLFSTHGSRTVCEYPAGTSITPPISELQSEYAAIMLVYLTPSTISPPRVCAGEWVLERTCENSSAELSNKYHKAFFNPSHSPFHEVYIISVLIRPSLNRLSVEWEGQKPVAEHCSKRNRAHVKHYLDTGAECGNG